MIALAFLVVWLHQRQLRSALWAAAGFGAGTVMTVVDLLRDIMPLPVVVAIVPMQWLAIALICQALLVRQNTGWSWRIVAVALIAPTAVHAYFFLIDPQLSVRLAQSFTVGGLIALASTMMLYLRTTRSSFIDQAILIVSGVCAIFYLLRAVALMGSVSNDAQWVGSNGMLTMYFGNALAALGLSLLLMIAIGMDMVAAFLRETRVDPLTGIGNRRKLDDAIAKDVEAGPLYGAAIMIDLDHFKAVNDRLGHAMGDQVLTMVARVLATHTGHWGTLARIGGEEFAILVTADMVDAAMPLATLTRTALLAQIIDGLDRPMTASIGIAMRCADEPLRDTLRRADMALYRAKAEGRDRVVLAPEDMPFQAMA